MITLAEAERTAAGWAHRQSLRRGYVCSPRIDELALGFAVWMQLPPEARTEPGEDVTTIIDRETGRLSHWPPSTPAQLDEMYTSRRDTVLARHQTADPVAELRREAGRRPTPTVAVHLTLGDRIFAAHGAKGDQELTHHPLVAGLLAAIPANNRVRGAERHAELLAVSDVLFEADQAREVPLGLDEARDLMRHADFQAFHVRERGDELGGSRAASCASCNGVLVNLAVVPENRGELLGERRAAAGADPQPGRFPAEVAWELAAGNWRPWAGVGREQDADRTLTVIEKRRGLEFGLERFSAAVAAYVEFEAVGSSRSGPGTAQRVRPFQLGSGNIWQLADPLTELGEVVGARLFPLGAEGFDESVLAIDERGRVFALDQGGEWFIADSLDAALVALVTGGPAARIRDDGTW